MSKWLHWLFHSWGPWSEPENQTFFYTKRGSLDYKETLTIQERRCVVCNKTDWRRA